MKNVFYFLALIISLSSCSGSDDPNEEQEGVVQSADISITGFTSNTLNVDITENSWLVQPCLILELGVTSSISSNEVNLSSFLITFGGVEFNNTNTHSYSGPVNEDYYGSIVLDGTMFLATELTFEFTEVKRDGNNQLELVHGAYLSGTFTLKLESSNSEIIAVTCTLTSLQVDPDVSAC